MDRVSGKPAVKVDPAWLQGGSGPGNETPHASLVRAGREDAWDDGVPDGQLDGRREPGAGGTRIGQQGPVEGDQSGRCDLILETHMCQDRGAGRMPCDQLGGEIELTQQCLEPARHGRQRQAPKRRQVREAMSRQIGNHADEMPGQQRRQRLEGVAGRPSSMDQQEDRCLVCRRLGSQHLHMPAQSPSPDEPAGVAIGPVPPVSLPPQAFTEHRPRSRPAAPAQCVKGPVVRCNSNSWFGPTQAQPLNPDSDSDSNADALSAERRTYGGVELARIGLRQGKVERLHERGERAGLVVRSRRGVDQ